MAFKKIETDRGTRLGIGDQCRVLVGVLTVEHQPHHGADQVEGSEARVIIGHACRAAALPVVTVIGLQLGALLGGAVVTESVFSWPGIGQLAIDAIQHRDYPVMQACVLVVSVSYILVNAATDSLSP